MWDGGARKISFRTKDGKMRSLTFAVAEVVKPLVSVGKITEAGNQVVLGGPNPHIRCKKSGAVIPVTMRNGTFAIELWIDQRKHGPVFKSAGFARPGH